MNFMRRMSLIMGALLLAVSCNNAPEADAEKTTAPSPQPKAAVEADLSALEVRIECTDQMKYSLDQITAKAGQEIQLSLVHVGELDKSVMGHNFVLLKKGTNTADFAAAAAQAKDSDYIPNGGTDVLAHTGLIGGGESTELSFTAPGPGIYDFMCSFPGHYAMMKGKLIVN